MKPEPTGQTVTRDIGKLSMRAAVDAASISEEDRTVDLIWTTGERVLRGFFDRYYEELSLDPKHVRMGRLESGNAPLLDTHNAWDTSSVAGVVESARLEKKQGICTVRFGQDETSDALFQKVRDGIVRNVSVGYRVHRLENTGEEVNKIPVYRATDWEPMEVSMVPIGADSGAAAVRGADTTNPCEIVGLATEEERSMKPKTPSPSTAETISQPAAEAPQVDTDAIRAEAQKEERERLGVIQRTGATLGLDAEFLARHTKDGTSADEFRALAFNEYEKRKAPVVDDTARPSIEAGEDQRDKFQRGVTAWLITRSGLSGKVSDAAKKSGETIDLDPGEFRGMTLMDIARSCLEGAGVKTRGLSKVDLAGLALTHRSSYASTSDFPVALEVALHKALLASYMVTPDTWSRICKRGSVSDFRAHNRYRRGSFGTLDTVLEGGEFKNKSIPDATKESIQAVTKGNLIGISRQSIINDDMGAFSDLAIAIGRAARLSIESDFYALLALNSGLGPAMNDGDTLFHANHNNIGTGAALAGAALDADDAVLAAQTDATGNEVLDLKSHILLLKRGLLRDAIVLNESQYEVDTSAKKAQVPNSVRGLFADIVGTARITGTRRYIFADPALYPTIEVAFLDGEENPYLEAKNGWDSDGVEWKVRLDYAVGAIDFRGAVTNAGTP